MKYEELLNKKQVLKRYIGSISQIAGIKKYTLEEGRAEGLKAIEVRTGGGLEYTILPGRGMDIAWCSYKGIPISYISETSVSSSMSYESEGMEWLRGFYAGMLTTCGLSNVGGPCEEIYPVIGRRKFGLHGRISYIPACETGTSEKWEDDKYIMQVTGKMREAIVHGENLTLRRTISSQLGGNAFEIRDEIENEGNMPQAMMVLYHMNVGFPLLDENSRFVVASQSVRGASTVAEEEIEQRTVFHPPIPARDERCYFYEPSKDDEGFSHAMLVNDEMELAVHICFDARQLGCLTEWKMLSTGEYVLGIEPGTNYPIGRMKAREDGTLNVLEPGEQRIIQLKFEVIEGRERIREIEKIIECIASR